MEEVRWGARDLGLPGAPLDLRPLLEGLRRGRARERHRRSRSSSPPTTRSAACPATLAEHRSSTSDRGAHPSRCWSWTTAPPTARPRAVAAAGRAPVQLLRAARTGARATPCGRGMLDGHGRAAAHDRRRPLHAHRGPRAPRATRSVAASTSPSARGRFPGSNVEVRQGAFREGMGRVFNLVVRAAPAAGPARHPVRLQAVHRARRPRRPSRALASTASPSTWRRWWWPAGAACASPRCP